MGGGDTGTCATNSRTTEKTLSARISHETTAESTSSNLTASTNQGTQLKRASF